MTDALEKARTLYVGSRDNLAGIVSTLSDTLTQRGARSFRRAVLAAASGDFSGGWDALTIGIDDLHGIYEEAFRRAGVAESTLLRGFEIDMAHPRVRTHLRRRSADLVSGITAEVRASLRQVLARGSVEGLQPEELASRIKGIIGLSPRDVQAVDNLRAGMRAQGVPAGVANRRAKQYAERLLDARALVIARTEVIDAIETGRQELWEQAVEAGLVARKYIWRIWVTFEDERVCPICRPLDGARARLGGTFHKGGQSSPRPPAHPNCRCSVDYEVARFRIKKHGQGTHDEKSHGNWARGKRTLFHGTRYHGEEIRADERLRPSEQGEKGPGVYFTPDLETARRFSQVWDEGTGTYVPSGDIFEVEFDLDQLNILDLTQDESIFRTAEMEAMAAGGRFKVSQILRDKGYDGVVHFSPGDPFPEYVIFDAVDIAKRFRIKKHHGPGPHPGTGSPQSVHGRRGEAGSPGVQRSAARFDGGLYIDNKWTGVHTQGIMEWKDLPSQMFHITTRGDLVDKDRVLRAAYEGGLGGQTGDQFAVSLTTSNEVAFGLNRDLTMMARLYQKHWASRPTRASGSLSADHEAWSKGVYRSYQAEAKSQGWSFVMRPGDQWISTFGEWTVGDWGSQFFIARERNHPDNTAYRLGESNTVSKLWRNPLFFGSDTWGPRLKPGSVRTVQVPRWKLDPKVLATDFDLGSGFGLEEVRYWGDIDVSGLSITKHAGPGPHPGTGTSQDVHGQRGSGVGALPAVVLETDWEANIQQRLDDRGWDPELVMDARVAMKELLDDADIYIRIDDQIFRNNVMVDGYFKNQKGSGFSNGYFDVELRDAVDETLFDEIGEDAFPIYGMMLVDPFAREGSGYGNVAVKLKDHMREVTTFTMGDSLDVTGVRQGVEALVGGYSGPHPPTWEEMQGWDWMVTSLAASPLSNPEPAALNGFFNLLGQRRSPRSVHALPVSYVEAQVHQEIMLKDIASIHTSTTLHATRGASESAVLGGWASVGRDLGVPIEIRILRGDGKLVTRVYDPKTGEWSG